MAKNKLVVYFPQERLKERPVERLEKLAKKRDRSVNYLIVQAILEYLEMEEEKKSG